MKERPIPMTAESVRAILAGTKVQTRRLVKPQPNDLTAGPTPMGAAFMGWHEGGDVSDLWCHYGVPGDRLWVREAWGYRGSHWCSNTPAIIEQAIHYQADDSRREIVRPNGDNAGIPKQVCRCKPEGAGRDRLDVSMDHNGELRRYWASWRHWMFMPRWASRLTLEVTEVRVQRLQEISEDDALAEGIQREALPADPDNFHPPGSYGYVTGAKPFPEGRIHVTPPEAYADLWDSINGKRALWESNPFVWAISFRLLPVGSGGEAVPR